MACALQLRRCARSYASIQAAHRLTAPKGIKDLVRAEKGFKSWEGGGRACKSTEMGFREEGCPTDGAGRRPRKRVARSRTHSTLVSPSFMEAIVSSTAADMVVARTRMGCCSVKEKLFCGFWCFFFFSAVIGRLFRCCQWIAVRGWGVLARYCRVLCDAQRLQLTCNCFPTSRHGGESDSCPFCKCTRDTRCDSCGATVLHAADSRNMYLSLSALRCQCPTSLCSCNDNTHAVPPCSASCAALRGHLRGLSIWSLCQGVCVLACAHA